MSKNRLNQYFDTLLFDHVEFEKFDPKTVKVVETNSVGDLDDNHQESFDINSISSTKKNTKQEIIVHYDNQINRTLSTWIGNCNVNLSKSLFEKLLKVDGVETLDVLTRYRFRVGIGKMFKDEEVRKNIAKIIKDSLIKS